MLCLHKWHVPVPPQLCEALLQSPVRGRHCMILLPQAALQPHAVAALARGMAAATAVRDAGAQAASSPVCCSCSMQHHSVVAAAAAAAGAHKMMQL